MNRAQRRAMARKKGSGMSFADQLAARRVIKQRLEERADDALLQYQADTATQRAMWLMVCSIADAFHFGPKKMETFFAALQANTEELEGMLKENGEEYAYEKLRRKASQVSGIDIAYLYEHDWKMIQEGEF